MFFVLRHSERSDMQGLTHDPNKSQIIKVENPNDPPLAERGIEIANKTGNFIKKELDYMKSNGEISKTAKVMLICSPYLRCLQTCEIIGKVLDIENIVDKTVYVEDAVQEFCNNKAGVSEATFEDRSFNNLTEKLKTELFSDLKPVYNKSFFDYENNPIITVNHPETVDHCFQRYSKAFDIMADYTSKPENSEKVVICVTHGCAWFPFYKDRWQFPVASQEIFKQNFKIFKCPSYCGLSLIQRDQNKVYTFGEPNYGYIIENKGGSWDQDSIINSIANNNNDDFLFENTTQLNQFF